MKRLVAAVCLSFACASIAYAADSASPVTEKKAPTVQQVKMASCNKEAGDKKLAGDDRKKFMSNCLKAKPAAATAEKKAPTAQQAKMASCNKDAGNQKLKGDARKKFMSDCLKAKPAT